jgi:hypothetical protein
MAQARAKRIEQKEAWAETQALVHAQAQARIRAQKQAEAQALARARADAGLAAKLRQQTQQQQQAQQQHWKHQQEEQQVRDCVEALKRAEALKLESGVRGVCANNVQQSGNATLPPTWSAWCYRSGKDHALGVFATKEAAAAAYIKTVDEWYGDVKKEATGVDVSDVAHARGDDAEAEQATLRETQQRKCAEREASAIGSYSGYHGVEMFGQSRWRAWLFVPKTNFALICKKVTLGVFDSKKEAGKAYDEAARNRYGAEVECNFGNTIAASVLISAPVPTPPMPLLPPPPLLLPLCCCYCCCSYARSHHQWAGCRS